MARSRFLLRAAVTLSSPVFSAVLAGIIQPLLKPTNYSTGKIRFHPLNTLKDAKTLRSWTNVPLIHDLRIVERQANPQRRRVFSGERTRHRVLSLAPRQRDFLRLIHRRISARHRNWHARARALPRRAEGRAHFPCAAFEICAFCAF